MSLISIYTFYSTTINFHIFKMCLCWYIIDIQILGVNVMIWYIHILSKNQIRLIGISITLNIYLFFMLETYEYFSSSYFEMCNRLLLTIVTLLYHRILALLPSNCMQISINILLSTALTASYKFWYTVLLLWLISKHF